MTDEITEGRNAARALAAKVPGWMVWYGERTGRFWAVPRVTTRMVARMLEAPTAEDLEEEIRRAEGRPARQAAPASGTSHAAPGGDPAPQGQQGQRQTPARQDAPGGEPAPQGQQGQQGQRQTPARQDAPGGEQPRHRRPADAPAPRIPVTH